MCNPYPQLKRVLEVVPENQRHIIVYEELFDQPARHYQLLQQFLGVPVMERSDFPVVNAAQLPRHALLHRVLSRPPFPLKLAYKQIQKLNVAFGWHLGTRAMQWIGSKPQSASALPAEFQEELHQYFAADILALEGLLSKSFDLWRKRG